jgi:hypothetical protein
MIAQFLRAGRVPAALSLESLVPWDLAALLEKRAKFVCDAVILTRDFLGHSVVAELANMLADWVNLESG